MCFSWCDYRATYFGMGRNSTGWVSPRRHPGLTPFAVRSLDSPIHQSLTSLLHQLSHRHCTASASSNYPPSPHACTSFWYKFMFYLKSFCYRKRASLVNICARTWTWALTGTEAGMGSCCSVCVCQVNEMALSFSFLWLYILLELQVAKFSALRPQHWPLSLCFFWAPQWLPIAWFSLCLSIKIPEKKMYWLS